MHRLRNAFTARLQVYDKLEEFGAAEAEVARILVGLGFHNGEPVGHEPSLQQPLSELSGGWRMKVELAKALWLKPDLLLLDEPTNHLDFHALGWLQAYLQGCEGMTTVVVSHNSSFLQGLCHIFLCLQGQKVERVKADDISTEELSALQMSEQMSSKKLPEKGKQGKGGKQAKAKCLPEWSFEAAEKPEDHGLSFDHVYFSHEASASCLLQDLHGQALRFSGRCRKVILGRNGSGKSSFLSLCIGKLLPTSGTVDTGQLRIGHVSQHFNEELDLEHFRDLSAASYLLAECREKLIERARGASDDMRLLEHARAVLVKFGLRGDTASLVALKDLSGGQKARVNFAYLSLRPCHMLFLDEPTNHLDAEASEALAKALEHFQGGIVLVSHDELLIQRVLNSSEHRELLVCEHGGIRSGPSLRDYLRQAYLDQWERSETAAQKALRPRMHGKRQEHGRQQDEAAVKLKEFFASHTKRKMPLREPLSQSEKDARKLKKALREIEELKTKNMAGERLRPNQLEKIQKEQEKLRELKQFTD